MSQANPEQLPQNPFESGVICWRWTLSLLISFFLACTVSLIFVSPSGAQTEHEPTEVTDLEFFPASWMQRFHEAESKLDELTLSEICIPGTHDSGAYQVLGKMAQLASRWVVTQELNLREQLEAGARKLDLRVMKIRAEDDKLEPGLYLHHGGFPTVSLEEALAQISTYLKSDAAKSETVLLEFTGFKGLRGQADTDALAGAVVEALGDQLYRKKQGSPTLIETPLRELKGKALFLLAGRRPSTGADSAAIHALGRKGLEIFDRYANRDITEEMIADQAKKFSKFTASDQLFQLCWTLTPQKSMRLGAGVKKLADGANAKLAESFKSDDLPFHQPNAAGQIVNIINVDFFGVEGCQTLKTCWTINSRASED